MTHSIYNSIYSVSSVCYTVYVNCSAEIVCANSLEHIQNNEVIMTLGNSRLVERFFKVKAISMFYLYF